MKKLLVIIKNLGFMTKYSAKFSKAQYFIAILDIVWSSVVPFVDLLFPKWILDELTGEKRWKTVLLYIGLWTATNGILLLLKSTEWVLLTPYNSRCDFKEVQMWGSMDAYMDYSRLENGAVMDERSRVKNNLYISTFAYQPCASLISTLIQLAGYSYIVATLHPFMILFLLLVIFVSSLLSKKREKIKYEYQSKIAKFQRRFQYLFNTMIGYPYAKEVRINKAAEWIARRYDVETKDYLSVFRQNQKKIFGVDTLSDLVLFAQTVVLYVYSAYRMVTGAITIGSFSMYIGAISTFCSTFTSMLDQLNSLKFLSDYIGSFKNYLEDAKPAYARKGILDIDDSAGKYEIEFQNVSFRYPGHDHDVLKNVSVKINSGERLSVVGYNGAGKTTFIKLLCRLYEPTQGRILLNGVDIAELKYDQYINLLSVVFQDYNIYPMSVRENLCLAGVHSDEDIFQALEKSGLWDKVKNLPYGIETQVGKEFDPEGIEFSGGEGQKLACARAYLKNAPIIILDEPTASLDSVSESQLYERFNKVIGKKTAIYISHRLASVKFCDRVIVFEDGRAVESGTHNELMRVGGVYSEMFTKQAEYYVEFRKEGRA